MKILLTALVSLVLITSAFAAEPKNPSTPLPQPAGATRYFTQFELQQGLRYRILVVKQNGSIEAALDPSRIDTLEFPGGGDSGAGVGGAGTGDAGTGDAGAGTGDSGSGAGGK